MDAAKVRSRDTAARRLQEDSTQHYFTGCTNANANPTPPPSHPFSCNAPRTWNDRHFKLEGGELRYYDDKTMKQSSLKRTVSLLECPALAYLSPASSAGGAPSLIIPLTSHPLTLRSKDSAEWLEAINVTISQAKPALRWNTAGDEQQKRLSVDKEKRTSAGAEKNGASASS